MESLLGAIWPFRRALASADGSSTNSRRRNPRHLQGRVSSIGDLEKLAELQHYILTGDLSGFTKGLGSFPSSLDILYPSRWVIRPALVILNPQGRHLQRRLPASLCLLHVAASRGRQDMVELLLAAGASPNVLDSNGESALHHAATNPGSFRALQFHSFADQSRLVARWTSGSHRCVELLCSVPGIDVNINSRLDKSTPLHRACEAGRHASVSVLLAHGADPNVLNSFGETPAAMALIAGHEHVFRLFLDLGIIHGRLDAIPYILHTCVNAYTESPTQDKFIIIEEILQHDVDLNEQDQLGNAPLHYAAAGCLVDYHLISTLLARGSDADLKNKMGRTPLIEFFFSHQIHINYANIKSVVLLASHMTTTPSIPAGQCVADNVHSGLWSRLYQEITEIIRVVSIKLPSLRYLCRQAVRRAVRPHRLGDQDIIRELPLPRVLRDEVANRVDPESYCGHLVDYLLERRELPHLDFLNGSLDPRLND
ncbi:serine/threonine-protein phosphatase 6 regulatory ankyrin repeat subunit C-like [Patiria miniata]|uniref:SOCS box domain-containing protein n=1 Tax=Patiria miniata TaxID=46514 RepID=A0A913ZV50_PATMI|nr:serine/threonine-protein phosphatase 6 regulatory ankyrin repeat subunit C-like [Patiria miniata]